MLHQFNIFSTKITEALWYLDAENNCQFFIMGLWNPRKPLVPFSLMHLAVCAENVGAVKFYLENFNLDKNPGVQIGNLKGRGPLHFAAKKGMLQVVQLIKQHLGLVNPSDCFGVSVLHVACAIGHLEIVKEICMDLDDKNPITIHHNTPLHLAARSRRQI